MLCAVRRVLPVVRMWCVISEHCYYRSDALMLVSLLLLLCSVGTASSVSHRHIGWVGFCEVCIGLGMVRCDLVDIRGVPTGWGLSK